MADTYLDLDVTPLEADAVADLAIRQLEFIYPGWQPADGDLVTWLISQQAATASELSQLISTATQALFRSIGQTLHGIPAQEATQATGLADFALTDTDAHTIPAGTQVAVGDVAFETTADASNGGDIEITDVPIQAIDAGAAGSGLQGTADLLDQLPFVTATVVQAVTTGGVDAETDDVYQDRLATLLALASPMPILPRDFVRYALTVPGVGRAVALDLYDPGPPVDVANPGHMTLAIAGTDGLAVPAGVKLAVNALFNDPDTGRRGLTQVVHVIDHGYSSVDVTFGLVALPGWDTTQVRTAAIDRLNEFFSPANWGRVDQGETAFYVNRPTVRIFDVATELNEVDGVDYVSTLQIGVDGGAQIGSNNTLVGGGSPVPLPTPGVITGTVTAP